MKKSQSRDDDILRGILSAREERAWLQKFFLASIDVTGSAFAAQLSLNIPGWPKRVQGDLRALSVCASMFIESARGVGTAPFATASLSNFAGPALLCIFAAQDERLAPRLKEISAEIEGGAEWHRVLDIDIITRNGPISRASIGLPPRKCLLCEDEAKVCARVQRHPAEDLRKRVETLLGSIKWTREIRPPWSENFREVD